MSNQFVWSGATAGANDGASWNDAYLSLMRDWGAEADFTPATDFVYVRSVHDETQSTTQTVTGSTAEGTVDVAKIITVIGDTSGTTPGNLATGAKVTTDGTTDDIHINEGLYIYGVNFFSTDDIRIGNGANVDHDITMEQCRLELLGTANGDLFQIGQAGQSGATKVRFIDVTVDWTVIAQGMQLLYCDFDWSGGGVDFDSTNFLTAWATASKGKVHLRGLDLSVLASSNLVVGTGNTNRTIIFSRCLLATSAVLVGATIDVPGQRAEFYHCQIGTDCNPAFQMQI